MTDQTQGHFRSIPIDAYREHFQPGDHMLVDVREDWEWAMGICPAQHTSP